MLPRTANALRPALGFKDVDTGVFRNNFLGGHPVWGEGLSILR